MSQNEFKRQKLKEVIQDRSLSVGKFKLSSGKESNYYFDMKPTMMDPIGAALIADQILSELENIEYDYIGGLELGAVPIVSSTVALNGIRGINKKGFIVRKKAKEHGTKNTIEGLTEGENLKNKRIVIVEDVTTTGNSAAQVLSSCSAEGAVVVAVISVVDRETGAADFFQPYGVEFKSLFKASEFEKSKPNNNFNFFNWVWPVWPWW